AWVDRLRVDFEYRRDHVEARPARTYVALQKQIEVIGPRREEVRERKLVIARPVAQIAESSRVPLTRLSAERRERFTRSGKEVVAFQENRRVVESGERGGDAKSVRVKVQRSPVSARTPEGRGQAPGKPSTGDAPEPRKLRSRGEAKSSDSDH